MLAGRGDVIRILVPLVIDDRDLDAALARLAASCDAILSAEVKQNS
jgi:4-aminobutyrate aminotransferase-like enzyme